MKIAVVHWLVNDVGGINSWTENFIEGCRRLGHTVQLYYGSHQTRLACDPNHKVPRSRRYHLLPAVHLSYHPNEVKASVAKLRQWDLIVFAHPSPHPTKGNTQVDHERGWQAFYTDTPKVPNICVFHDRHWDRTNPWIAEVRDFVDYAHAAQHHFIESVKLYSGKKTKYGWGYFPLVLPERLPPAFGKIRRWVLATQWLAIKNHRHLIPHLGELKCPLHSYGSGQTYHKLLPEMRKVYLEDHHQDEVMVYNPSSRHIHYGHTEYRQLLKAMRHSWFSLDMATQGMTNMTHWEPMTVGTISVMEERTLNDKHCEIPDDCCFSFKLDNLIDDLNSISKSNIANLLITRGHAWKFIQRCDCAKVADKILGNL